MSEIVNIKILDERLQKMLNAYGTIPERDAEAAHRTQAKFLNDLDRYLAEPTLPKSSVGSSAFSDWMTNLLHGSFSGRRTVTHVLVTLIVLGIFLSGGAGISAYAASSSLPGDVMYPIKTTMENAQMWLTRDSEARSRLYLEFAGQRLSEIQSLIAAGRYADIARAVHEFERDIQMALNAVQSLSRTDPEHAAALNAEVAAILRGYRHILTRILVDVPEEVQPVIKYAIDVADLASHPDNDDNDDRIGDGVYTSTPMPTMSATPERELHVAPTIAPTATPTPSITLPTPISGGNNSNNNDASDENDDDNDDDDDDDDDD